jgi:nicotinamidase-related amidase
VSNSSTRDALIVVDMLNRYDHEDADLLVESVRERVPAMRRMIGAAREHDDTLLVYVNDCFGEWSANAPKLVDHALGGRAPDLVEPIVPEADDPFVIKARHSIFYQTQLEYLLRTEGISRFTLIGQVTEQCILYSALDGYVRHFEVSVAPDAVAHIREDYAEAALRMMETNMHARLVPADASAFAGHG